MQMLLLNEEVCMGGSEKDKLVLLVQLFKRKTENDVFIGLIANCLFWGKSIVQKNRFVLVDFAFNW